MATEIEALVYEGVLSTVGDPLYIGLLVLAFFGGFVILQNTSMPQKIFIIIAATFLASAFVPFLGLIAALATAAVFYAGVMRVISK